MMYLTTATENAILPYYRLDVDVSGGTGSFLPTESTPHELRAFVNGVLAECCPMFIEVFPDISRILYSGIAPCALGSLVEVLVRAGLIIKIKFSIIEFSDQLATCCGF